MLRDPKHFKPRYVKQLAMMCKYVGKRLLRLNESIFI